MRVDERSHELAETEAKQLSHPVGRVGVLSLNEDDDRTHLERLDDL